jgi:hypothetical protein
VNKPNGTTKKSFETTPKRAVQLEEIQNRELIERYNAKKLENGARAARLRAKEVKTANQISSI